MFGTYTTSERTIAQRILISQRENAACEGSSRSGTPSDFSRPTMERSDPSELRQSMIFLTATEVSPKFPAVIFTN